MVGEGTQQDLRQVTIRSWETVAFGTPWVIVADLPARTTHDLEPLRAGQSSLRSVCGEKTLAFEFERQSNVQEVETAAPEPLRMAFGKCSSAQ